MPSIRTGTRPASTTPAIGSGTMAGGTTDISHGSQTFSAAVHTQSTLADADTCRLAVQLAGAMRDATDLVSMANAGAT